MKLHLDTPVSVSLENNGGSLMTDKKQPKTFDPSVPENNWDWIQRRRFMNADAEITPPSDSYTMKLEDGDEFKVRKNSTS
jgi:hypothetical protein